jgi:uncharacterized protein (DUF169 family)
MEFPMHDILLDLSTAIMKNVKPSTSPVAIRLAGPGEELGQKFKQPGRDFGHKIAVCQGLNIARTLGWTIKFGIDDHACPLALIAAGQLAPDDFLGGAVADLYQDDPEVAGIMEATYPMQEGGKVKEIWLSALERCEFEPDLVIVYGTPAQILVLVHAANYGRGEGVYSSSTGRLGCATWIAGIAPHGECRYAIPCSGERVFAGTQDHEMSFMIPRLSFSAITKNLGIMRKKGTYRYPVPNLSLLVEPDLPKKYVELGKGRKS